MPKRLTVELPTEARPCPEGVTDLKTNKKNLTTEYKQLVKYVVQTDILLLWQVICQRFVFKPQVDWSNVE